jgi:ankyrin repeat protein
VLLAAVPPAEVNWQNEEGDTALSYAAANDSTPAVNLLLTHGANDTVSFYGATCLMQAVYHDHMAVVELLLARFPTLLNARAQNGATALHIAVSNDTPHIVDALLAAGADPNIARNDGTIPLMEAPDVEMMRRLLDGGADVNARYKNGNTVLLAACSGENLDALIALLLERGADATASRSDGWNSLMLAACNNAIDIIEMLLQSPVMGIDTQAHDGVTALIVASENGATAVVDALIAAGADVHLADNEGYTALHVAANADIARLLWNAGAQDTLAHDGVNTLMSACSNSTEEEEEKRVEEQY